MSQILLFDGLEPAFIGYAERAGSKPLAVYDFDKMVECLADEGFDHDEAIEYLQFNTVCAYLGEGTPLVLYRCTIEEMEDAMSPIIPAKTDVSAEIERLRSERDSARMEIARLLSADAMREFFELRQWDQSPLVEGA
jgi:hypothetical protein